MSAYVVENATINRVVSFLAIDREGDYLRRTILRETGCDLSTREGKDALGKAMFALNCNAVDQRYGEGESKSFRDDMTYTFALDIAINRLQAYKSLNCWLYQCAEGDVPGSSLLYAAMERVKGEMADDIVSRLPQYESQKWD